jgi:hypothetical protein
VDEIVEYSADIGLTSVRAGNRVYLLDNKHDLAIIAAVLLRLFAGGRTVTPAMLAVRSSTAIGNRSNLFGFSVTGLRDLPRQCASHHRCPAGRM